MGVPLAGFDPGLEGASVASSSKCEFHEGLYEGLREAGIRSASSGCVALVQALERLAGRDSRTVGPVDDAVRWILRDPDGVWRLSDLYWRLRRSASGVTHGVVFTPSGLADLVVGNLADGMPVVDLGAGTGMLSLTAAERGFQVTAVERDPEMASVLACLARIKGVADQVSVVVGDALEYTTDLPSQIMSNPPYTRHHHLSAGQKQNLLRLSESLGMPLRRTAGHYVYFMLYAWKAVWSKREVLLIPTNWLETRYGEPLKDYLIDNKDYSLTPISHEDGPSAFRHALTTSCILTTRSQSLASSAGGRHPLPTERSSTPSARAVEEKTLNVRLHAKCGSYTSNVQLGEVLRVRRGIATGANDLFVVSRDESVLSEFPMDELTPIVRRLKDYDDPNINFFLWTPKLVPSASSLERIRYGEAALYHQRALCRSRRPWWQIPVGDPPAYLLSYMGRNEPAILRNHRRLLNLNNIHGIDPVDGVSEDVSHAVINWLKSTDGYHSLLRVARRYQGGLWKLEPGDIHRVAVPPSLMHDANPAMRSDQLARGEGPGVGLVA